MNLPAVSKAAEDTPLHALQLGAAAKRDNVPPVKLPEKLFAGLERVASGTHGEPERFAKCL